MKKSSTIPLTYRLLWPWWYFKCWILRPALPVLPPPLLSHDVDFEIGFLGDLMGLGDKDMILDPKISEFFESTEKIIFNLEGLIDEKKRPVLITQTTNHYRHLETLNQLFDYKLVAGVANNHIDDLSKDDLNKCIDRVKSMGIDILGLHDADSMFLRPGLRLTAKTYWKGRNNTSAATLESDNHQDQEILFLHQGNEFQNSPTEDDRHRIHQLSDNVIAVICHHSHFPQPIEIDKKIIAHSIGNLAVKFGGWPVNWGIALKLGLKFENKQWVIKAYEARYLEINPSEHHVTVRIHQQLK